MDNCDLLVEVLTHFSPDLDCSELVEKAINFLTRSRPHVIAAAFLSLADRLVKSDSALNASFSTSLDVDGVCNGADPSIQMLWDIIFDNSSSRDKLMSVLAKDIRDEAHNDGVHKPNLVFKINCLYVLASQTKNTTPIAEELDDLSDNAFEEGATRDGMNAVLAAISAGA